MALDDPQGLRKAFTSAFEDLQAQLEAKQPPLVSTYTYVYVDDVDVVLDVGRWSGGCGGARARRSAVPCQLRVSILCLFLLAHDIDRRHMIRCTYVCSDARAVLIHADGTPTRLSLDHKPHLPAEKARIEGLGSILISSSFSVFF